MAQERHDASLLRDLLLLFQTSFAVHLAGHLGVRKQKLLQLEQLIVGVQVQGSEL
jgi:hypothetical protein